MPPESVTDPGVIDRVDVDVGDPDPSSCLPPGEEPLATVRLSPGWVAVTEREVLCHHPDGEPPLARTSRHNVTGLVVRRAGARSLLRYLPRAVVAAVLAVAGGLLLLSVDPASYVDPPDAEAVEGTFSFLDALSRGTDVLGAALVFGGILAGLAALAVLGYWLVSRDVLLVVERGGATPIECPTTRASGTRAVGSLREALVDTRVDTRPARPAAGGERRPDGSARPDRAVDGGRGTRTRRRAALDGAGGRDRDDEPPSGTQGVDVPLEADRERDQERGRHNQEDAHGTVDDDRRDGQ